MFARNKEGLLGFGAFQHLVERIELDGLGGTAQVAGVNEEIGWVGQRVDLFDGGLERAHHFRGLLVVLAERL